MAQPRGISADFRKKKIHENPQFYRHDIGLRVEQPEGCVVAQLVVGKYPCQPTLVQIFVNTPQRIGGYAKAGYRAQAMAVPVVIDQFWFCVGWGLGFWFMIKQDKTKF